MSLPSPKRDKKLREERHETSFNQVATKAFEEIRYLCFTSNSSIADIVFNKYAQFLYEKLNRELCTDNKIHNYIVRLKEEIFKYERKYLLMLKKEEELVQKISEKIDEIIDSKLAPDKKKEKIDKLIERAKRSAVSPFFLKKIETPKYISFLEVLETASNERDKLVYNELVTQMEEIYTSSLPTDKKIKKINDFFEKASNKLKNEFFRLLLDSERKNMISKLNVESHNEFIVSFSERLDNLEKAPGQTAQNRLVTDMLNNDPEIKKMLDEIDSNSNDNPTNSSGTKH